VVVGRAFPLREPNLEWNHVLHWNSHVHPHLLVQQCCPSEILMWCFPFDLLESSRLEDSHVRLISSIHTRAHRPRFPHYLHTRSRWRPHCDININADYYGSGWNMRIGLQTIRPSSLFLVLTIREQVSAVPAQLGLKAVALARPTSGKLRLT
jgi:hypothetical protein